MTVKYRAVQACSNQRTDEVTPAGGWHDVSHLTPDEVMLLMTMQPPALEAVQDEQPAPDPAQEEA
jgi:hypothetical protein